MGFLPALIKKNDSQARWLIGIFSFVVFTAVVILGKVKLEVEAGFNIHILAFLNAVINSIIAILLLSGLAAVKSKRYTLHKNLMFAALILSIFFLLSYIAHHLLTGEAVFGDINHDGVLNEMEKQQIGNIRSIYLFILATHIILAAVILPFILFTTYRP